MEKRVIFAFMGALLVASLISNTYLLIKLRHSPERILVKTAPTKGASEAVWWKPDTAQALADSTATDPDLLNYVSHGFGRLKEAEQLASLERWCVRHMYDTYGSLPSTEQITFLKELRKEEIQLLAERDFES